jgi:hypothetical protein
MIADAECLSSTSADRYGYVNSVGKTGANFMLRDRELRSFTEGPHKFAVRTRFIIAFALVTLRWLSDDRLNRPVNKLRVMDVESS